MAAGVGPVGPVFTGPIFQPNSASILFSRNKLFSRLRITHNPISYDDVSLQLKFTCIYQNWEISDQSAYSRPFTRLFRQSCEKCVYFNAIFACSHVRQ